MPRPPHYEADFCFFSHPVLSRILQAPPLNPNPHFMPRCHPARAKMMLGLDPFWWTHLMS